MVDGIVLGVILVSAVFGLIRGIVSQVMALAGLALAVLFAPRLGGHIGGFVQGELGCSRFMADKLSVFLLGTLIYFGMRLIGYAVEKFLVNRVRPLWKLNRIGGALLGALKSVVTIAIVFAFLALLPPEMLAARTPKVLESRSYRWATRFNPMADPEALGRIRALRNTVLDPVRRARLEKDPKAKELFRKHGMDNPLRDQRVMTPLREGDYERLRHNEKVEELMNDQELSDLLVRLEKAEKL